MILLSDNQFSTRFDLGHQVAMTMTVYNDTSVRLAVNWGEVKFLCALPIATQKRDNFLKKKDLSMKRISKIL